VHIGFFAPAWPVNEFANGIITYVHQLRNELLEQGHRVSVFANVIGGTNRDSAIYLVKATTRYKILQKLSGLARRGSHDVFSWGRAIAAAINEVNTTDPIDVLEMEESFGWCADVQQLVPIPIVVKLHGPAFLTLVEQDVQSDLLQTRIDMEGKALRQISSLLSPSQSALLSTTSRYQLNPALKKVIPNPIALGPESERWDLEHCDKKTILFVGRFDRLKGADTALMAFQRLLELDNDLRLIFVGPDAGMTSKDGSRVGFDQFRNSLFTEDQRTKVIYLGKLPRSDIFALRTKAFVTLVASRWEAQGYTALEAMMQGCPIVANRTGGLSEIVHHQVTGLLARLDDIEDLCRKVLYLLDHPARAREMGENARKFVTNHYSGRELATQTIDFYRQAISKAKHRES
jgi:glycosyltransferase involved in cell wall biosynthesis